MSSEENSVLEDFCFEYKTCSNCQAQERCEWNLKKKKCEKDFKEIEYHLEEDPGFYNVYDRYLICEREDICGDQTRIF